jgi:large subunit ribosomal protein L21e
MVKRIGRRRKARHKLMQHRQEKGKVPIQRFVQGFKQGDNVVLKAYPAYHKGLYFMRFHGKTGTVKAKRGRCYEVKIRNGGKQKCLIIHPVHLQKA